MQTCSFRPGIEALRMAFWMLQLGQFIASSPTLFPKEYVTEFQKCLDQTGESVVNVVALCASPSLHLERLYS